MRLPATLRAFLWASVLAAALCLGTEAVCRFLLGWGGPYDYPGVHGWISFVDFHAFFPKFIYFHSRQFFAAWAGLPYPAPAVVVYKLFLTPQPRPGHGGPAVLRFIGAALLTSLFMLYGLWRALQHHGLASRSAGLFVLATYALSFAFWFAFVQGNVEWVVWAVLSAGVWFFCRQQFAWAGVCIGVAGSMKLFPIIFIGLLLAARRWTAAAITLVAAAVSTVVSLWLVCPDISYSWHQTAAVLTGFGQKYMVHVRPVEVGFDHSLFALIKLLTPALVTPAQQGMRLLLYLAVAALGGCLLWITRIRRLPVANQVLCLAIAAIVLPPVSYDYTLIHLYAGFALLCVVALEHARRGAGMQPRGLMAAFLLLAFLLAPESELIVGGVRYAGQIKCLALLALGGVALLFPFAEPVEPMASSCTMASGQPPVAAALR